jgi:hypothetical protein
MIENNQATSAVGSKINLADVPKMPENSSPGIKAEVETHLQVAVDTIEHALAALPNATPQEINDQLKTIQGLRDQVNQKNQSWQQRLEAIRALNQQINAFKAGAREAADVRPPAGTLRINSASMRALLGTLGVSSLPAFDHDVLSATSTIGVNLNQAEVESLRKERDALGDVPLEHTGAMDWIIAKLDEAAEAVRAAARLTAT